MEIVYVVHSCFILKDEDEVIIFDYPGDEFIGDLERETVVSSLRGLKQYFFVTHSHHDHYSEEIFELPGVTEKTQYVLSDDTYVKDSGHSILKVSPDERYSLDGLDIRTFKSNDQGVAFRIDFRGIKIYFGGDLAKWDWPEWSESKRREHVSLFEDTLETLKKEDIDIAFSNTDERLSSWAGPAEFIDIVKHDIFVPIHTFGNEGWIDDLVREIYEDEVEIFHYVNTGDSFRYLVKDPA